MAGYKDTLGYDKGRPKKDVQSEQTQNQLVLACFEGKEQLAVSEIRQKLIDAGKEIPLKSIQRAVWDLTRKKLLQSTTTRAEVVIYWRT